MSSRTFEPPRIGRRQALGVMGWAGAALAIEGPPATGSQLTSVTNDVLSTEVLRHGAYVCLRVPDEARRPARTAGVAALAERLGLRNEFEPGEGHPSEAVAFLRRVSASATAGGIADDHLLRTDAILHVASPSAAPVTEFCAEVERLLGGSVRAVVLRGVVRPPNYTGQAMRNFAYAHQVVQQPGRVMPNAFLLPMSKTPEWWAKDWMERHTYLLPRYDEAGRMLSQGHALAAAPGIPALMRRTYRNATEPAPEGGYDFLTYFECADVSVPIFHEVCVALRDVRNNPEWKFVREGPTWQGRRVGTWTELFD